jgi:hypothetical protein
MIERMTFLFLSALLVRLALYIVDLLLQPASELRLSLFRPYRGESWPTGVQEDDDMRFRWRAASTRVAGALANTTPRAAPARSSTLSEPSVVAGSATIEDVPAEAVPTQRPDRITVHGARH